MKNLLRRGGALALALTLAIGATAASASNAMGWEIHKGQVALSQGADLGKNIFWSDSYSDLRTEYYVTYSPNTAVVPTVAYGDKVLTRASLSSMAQTLESQGRRVVSGINGDFYVMATGAPVGMVITDGVLRSTPPYTVSWAIGFREDGTAFIGTPNVSVTATFSGQTLPVSGGINKVRKLTASDTTGGLTLMTSDFASTTQNTQPGVDVILTPVDPNSQAFADAAAAPAPAAASDPSPTPDPAAAPEGEGAAPAGETQTPPPVAPAAVQIPVAGATYNTQPALGQRILCTVDQVLESTGAVEIPEGKLVLTLNAKDNATQLAMLRALKSGELVDINVKSQDSRWNNVKEALGGMYKIVTNGQVESGLNSERTARSAVGIKADGTVIFYAMDGKQAGYSVGATLTQAAQRLVELGCVEAICLDGGGSTTLGVTTPVQSGMQVITSPSDGAERKNSTAIFLTTQLQPTGQLASYHVTPTDTMLLAGASVSLSATGVDSSYYQTAGSPVGWTITSGEGSVTPEGVFTAAGANGFTQVTASDGYASGSAYLTTVKTPDSISVSRESTGAAVTALALNPGEQVDLKASAVYKKLSLAAQDVCFTWALDPTVGTVDENGVLTAGEKSASGSLTVSAGGTSVTIPVSIAGHVKALETFEENLNAFAATDTASGALETGLDHVRYGAQSMRVAYDTTATGTATLGSMLPIPAGERYLGVWVYGDGSGNTLLGTAVDASLQSQQFLLTALDFTGWKHLSVALPAGAINLTGFDVVYAGGAAQSGTLWLDQLTTSNEEMHDTTPPTVSVTVSGTQLTASVLDNVDRNIPQADVSVTYDGRAITFTWNPVTGVVTATLPAADSGFHRVSVTAADASGNLGRGAADVKPSTPRGPVFSDMDGHWAGDYATYLYDTGVSQGTGGAQPQFQPGKNITRAEFFAMVARWMGLDLTQYAGVELPFADAASIPSWALGEVKAMYSLGIVQGSLDNGVLKLNAGATITRAEAMAILGRTQPKGYAEADLSAYTDGARVPDWAAPYVKTLVGQGVVSGYNNAISPLSPITRGEVAKLLYTMK